MKKLPVAFLSACALLCAFPHLAVRAEEVGVEMQIPKDKSVPGALIDDSTAVFFPPETTPAQWTPSVLWEKPPALVKVVGKDWKLRPTFSAPGGRFTASVTIPEGTDLYGGGEVTGPLRRNGTTVNFWNTDNYVYSRDHGSRLYQSHPWMMGVRPDGTAFGVIADSTWRGSMTEKDGVLTFAFDGTPFPVVVIEGAMPAAVVSKLARLTGHMEIPPLWSLGYQQCRWSYMSADEVRDIAGKFREKKIPADVMWMDIDYMDGFRVFTFDAKKFPDPSGLSDDLHKIGFHGVWMIDPGVKKDDSYAVYRSGDESGVWMKTADGRPYAGKVWPGEVRFPDFTRADTRAWWKRLTKGYVSMNRIDGIWNDMNEPSSFGAPDQTAPLDALHAGDGVIPAGTHLQHHNIYGMQMIRATREGLLAANPDKRPFVLTRSNFLGGQRYGATWTGDNASSEAHRDLAVPMTLTLGLSGQPFNGPDMGGFAGNASPELWAEWVSFGAYFPFCRGHAVKGAQRKEPWAFGEATETVARAALERRYRLIPYLYTLFREASIDGLPVMRPVFFAEPKDRALRAEQSAFLLGSDLLVVPAIAKHPALPSGDWREVKLLGDDPAEDSRQASLRVRPGAVIPLGEVVQDTSGPMLDTLTLVVNPGPDGAASGTLYEDAGDGFGYRNGDFRITNFASKTKNGVTTVTLAADGLRPSAVKRIVVRVLGAGREKTATFAPGTTLVVR